MKFVSVRDLKTNTAEVWEQLSREEMVITSNGHPIALMTGIGGENLEEILGAIRRARAQIAIRSLRQQAQERGLDQLTTTEIHQEIRSTRRQRKNS